MVFVVLFCGGEMVVVLSECIYVLWVKVWCCWLSNEDVLWLYFEVCGFRKLFLEELLWVEQIVVFWVVCVVVVLYGVGLVNLVFCEVGVWVVEIFNCVYVNLCFWCLVVFKGFDYWVVVVCGD